MTKKHYKKPHKSTTVENTRQAAPERKMLNKEAEMEKEETKETLRKKRDLPILFVLFPSISH